MSDRSSYQLMNDYTDSSMITIDGIDFAPVGFDDSESGFTEEDLKEGLQNRIHKAVLKIAASLNIEGVS